MNSFRPNFNSNCLITDGSKAESISEHQEKENKIQHRRLQMENFSGSRCSSLIPGSWHALEKLTSREPLGREIPVPLGRERNTRSQLRSNTLTTFWDLILSAIDNSISVSAQLKSERRSPSFTPTCKLLQLFPGLMTSPSFSPVLLQPSLLSHPSSGGTTATAAD